MALTALQIRYRAIGGAAGAPSALKTAELAYNMQDNTIYIGRGDDGGGNATSIVPVAGSGYVFNKNDSQSANTHLAAPDGVSGAPTFRLLVANDIPTITAAKISDFNTQVRTNRIDQLAAPTASVAFNNQRITGLADGIAATDAATVQQVQQAAAGIDSKPSVRAIAVSNITLSGTQTIDGVALIAGDRVLVTGQTTGSQNGAYVVAAGAWARAATEDQTGEITPGATWYVEEGTTYGGSTWRCANTGSITIGTTSISIQQFVGGSSYTAGNGLNLTGNIFSVVGTAGRIVVSGSGVDLASGIVTPNTYRSVTVDTYGRVTAGSNPTTLAGYGITDAQPLDATLTGIAGVATAADRLIYATGVDTFTFTTLTSFARTLLDDASNSDARTTLGLGTMATQNANSVAITGGTIDNITLSCGTF